MGEPIFIDTPKGDQLVILTREDYDALLQSARQSDEDAEDIALADQRMVEWNLAGRPAFPLEVFKLMRGGDSALRAFRKYRKLDQTQLSQMTGLGESLISALESGRETAPPEMLLVIARALDITPSSLLPLS